MPDYRLLHDSVQDRFGKLRTKIQIFGGGYGNGKTAAAVVQKALFVARNYPGCNILIARATYPKLNDTIRKEFIKWCNPAWIKSFPMSKNSDNTCTFKNGSVVNFRYIQQQGKGASEGEQTTSNLLSATYDLIIVDQLEDPEIKEKDFDDLLGRLRGNAKYIGDDPTMPTTGPRWFVACVNPTRNWVYRRIIAPIKKYEQTGIVDPTLLCKREPRDLDDGSPNPNADQPIRDADGKVQLIVSLVEGSTYTNKHNLGADFIETLESTYRGQSRDRFLYGEWSAYEGLVHPEFGEASHCYTQEQMFDLLDNLRALDVEPSWIEGYDFGIVEPSCYLLAFTDRRGNIFIVEGFYKPEQELSIGEQQKRITEMRKLWGADPDNVIWADPALAKRTAPSRNAGTRTIMGLFAEGDYGVRMRASDNAVSSGLTKVNTYLSIMKHHTNPFTGIKEAPHLYVATELGFVASEFTSYYWQQDTSGKRVDTPVEKNDHAMNTIKYMLAKAPDLAIRERKLPVTHHLHQWTERPDSKENTKGHRYG